MKDKLEVGEYYRIKYEETDIYDAVVKITEYKNQEYHYKVIESRLYGLENIRKFHEDSHFGRTAQIKRGYNTKLWNVLNTKGE